MVPVPMPTIYRTGFTRLGIGDGTEGPYRYNIIFLHGLRGHPQRTWGGGDHRQDNQASRSSSHLSFRSAFSSKRRSASSDGENQPQLFWPHALLPTDIPEARIWTYGYNADVIDGIFRTNNQNSVSQHGRDLAVKLEREVEDEPIIFVAHSLGGIVVKDAICRSDALQARTLGIVFLGTPHRGSSSAEWAQMASNLASIALQDTNTKLTGALSVDSEVLGHIHEQFIKVAAKRALRLHSFQEARGILGAKGFGGKVVGDFSSSLGLPGEQIETIDADHRQMVRCTGKDDARYRAVLSVLKQFIRLAETPDPDPCLTPSEKPVCEKPPVEVPIRSVSKLSIGAERQTLALNEVSPAQEPWFMVPFPENKRFVGREAVLADLRDFLFEDDLPSVAVVGLGGAGKTQVALQMAYWTKINKPGWSVFWLPALSMAGFEQSCTQMAEKLDLATFEQKPTGDRDASSDQDDAKAVMRKYLESHASGHWLLIVDNADDMHTLSGAEETHGIHQYLPCNANGRILFTTRSMDVARTVADDDVIELEAMTGREARDFLAKLLSGDLLTDDEAVATLLRALTFLPLAISQAAAFIKRNKIPITKYLSLLQDTDKEAIGLMSREFPDRTRYRESRHAVMTTWLISFNQLYQTDRSAADLLSFMSLVESRAIPEAMLPRSGTEEEFLHAIGTLCGYTFLQWRGDGELLDMHSLVHLAARVWLTQEGSLEGVKRAALAHLVTVFNSSEWADRKKWRQYMPHVLKALYDGKLEDWKRDECYLAYWAGQCLKLEDRTTEALEVLEHAVEAQARMVAADDPDLLTIRYALSGAYRRSGQIVKAIVILRQISETEQRTLPEDHPDRLSTQHGLATAYQANGQTREAIDLLEHVVAARLPLAADHPDLVVSQHVLATAYQANGQLKKAIDLLEHVVESMKQVAVDHPRRLTSQHVLATAYLANNQVKEAISLLEHVVEVRGAGAVDHPDRLQSQQVLASAYEASGRVEEAKDLLEHVVKAREALADDHPDRLASQNALASAYQSNNQTQEAIDLLKRIVKARETLPADNTHRLASQHLLAAAFHVNGQIQEAVDLLEYVVETRRAGVPVDDSDQLASQHALARAYKANGQVQKAVDLLEHIVEVDKAAGFDHAERLISQQALAKAYHANGQVEKAIELVKYVLKMQCETMGPEHPRRIVSEELLAQWTAVETASDE